MAPQTYKFVIIHAHEITGLKILSRLLHSRAPYIGGIIGDVQSDLETLEFKNSHNPEINYPI